MVGGSRDADNATNRARDVDRRPTPKQRAGRATAAGSHLSRHRRGSLRASPQPKAISSVESNASPLRDSCARERAELLNRRSRGHVRRDSVRSPPRGSRAFRARRCVRRVERICSEGGNRGKNQRACKTCTCGAGAGGKPRCVWSGSPQFPPFSNFVSFFLVTLRSVGRWPPVIFPDEVPYQHQPAISHPSHVPNEVRASCPPTPIRPRARSAPAVESRVSSRIHRDPA